MYYKILGLGGKPCHGGDGQRSLPHDGQPGEWMPKIHNIKPCLKGYHLCERGDVVIWINEEIYEAEGRGESIRHEDKTVFEEARLLRKLDKWDKRLQLLFSADCAEHVLDIFEKEYPTDDRPRKAIQATRDYANGIISEKGLAAARDAARDVAWAAWAARAGVGDAINKEKDWQTERLFELLGES